MTTGEQWLRDCFKEAKRIVKDIQENHILWKNYKILLTNLQEGADRCFRETGKYPEFGATLGFGVLYAKKKEKGGNL